ncbi:MAG: FAD-dependent oxidoreductase [Betaproteobacteria bacterium]|nr:FAD-dependent oxidoreductase [Betaproteobacteria bacterium]
MRPVEERFDVVVVGGGGSGLAAAIEARAAGARVALLEKNPALGGSTAWSIGSITSTRTPHQLARGIDDRPEDHFADMPGFAGDLAPRDNDTLRRILCEEVPDAFRWLLDLGVRFYGPMPEPPHRQPRMHNVLPNSRSYIYHLERHARRVGVGIVTAARASRLVVANGRVTAVECVDGRRFAATRGVVLAAGDFTNDPDLKRDHMGEQEAKVEGVNLTATGDGQKLALALGARIVNGDLALGPEIRFIAPSRAALVRRLPPWRALARTMEWALNHAPPALLRPFVMSFVTTALAPSPSMFTQGAMLVNREGRRFCDECDRPAYALPDQPGKVGYIVIDGALARRFSAWPHFVSTAPGVAYAYVPDYRRNRPDVHVEAPTLAALETKLGMPSGSFEASARELARARANRDRGAQQAAWEPPFVALGPVRAVFVHNEGGLAVDDQHRVLGPGDRPIGGLYAAGSTGQGGLLLKGHGHHLAWAFVSGRRAGRLVAGEAP